MGALGDALNSWYVANNNLVNTIGLNAMLALSIYVMLACGQLSLASPAYMAVGAYTAALLEVDWHWPFLAQIVAGTLLAGAVAFLLGLPLLRLRGVYLAISTVGFVAITQIFFTNWGPGGGGDGISIPATVKTWHIYLALAILCYLFWRLEGSALGRSLGAIRQDEEAARTLGIDTVAHKLGAFAVSGLVAGLTGVLYARLQFFIEPHNFDFDVGLDALTYVIVGGSLTFLGSPIGALLLTGLPEWLRPLHDYRAMADGLILLAVILFLPGGLVSLPGKLLAWSRGLRSRLVAARSVGTGG
jgi:branched-chain amino acid transport system permease protein